MKERLNQRLIQKMREIHLLRMQEVLEQQRQERKEKAKRDREQGRKRVRPEDMNPSAPVKFKSKLGDRERDIHEAYQILLAETIRRRGLRKKQSRIHAIKEKEAADAIVKRKTDKEMKKISKVFLREYYHPSCAES